jgi:hypothetical protein
MTQLQRFATPQRKVRKESLDLLRQPKFVTSGPTPHLYAGFILSIDDIFAEQTSNGGG